MAHGDTSIPENSLPEEVWGRLKAWAKGHARAATSPSADECTAYVRDTVRLITGHENAMRTEAVRFYSGEALELIALYAAEAALAARPPAT